MEHCYKTANENSSNHSATLFNAFKKGDINAFTKLYEMYINLLFNYGLKITSDKELLKDCIQEVFVKIYNKRNELDEVQNIKSYLIISLKNKLCDESRKRIHLSDIAVDEIDIISTDNVENNYIAGEKAKTDSAFVAGLMNKLSIRQRKAIQLYYFEERKYEDICNIMEMNYQSVRNLIHRGMVKLRSCAC